MDKPQQQNYIANTNENWGAGSAQAGEGTTNSVDDYLDQLFTSESGMQESQNRILNEDGIRNV